MDFTQAMELMESGKTIKRSSYRGYLFLDIDGNVKHAGKISTHERMWMLDLHEKDWEERMEEINREEITEARMEALLDQNSSNIKRMYWLEEIMEAHHKTIKKFVETTILEIEETRKALSTMVKFVSTIKETMKTLTIDRAEIVKQHNFDKKLKESIDDLIKIVQRQYSKDHSHKKKTITKQEEEKKEMEYIKKCLNDDPKIKVEGLK